MTGPPWASAATPATQNLIGGFIVVSIIVLSTLYGFSVLFPNLFK